MIKTIAISYDSVGKISYRDIEIIEENIDYVIPIRLYGQSGYVDVLQCSYGNDFTEFLFLDTYNNLEILERFIPFESDCSNAINSALANSARMVYIENLEENKRIIRFIDGNYLYIKKQNGGII